MKYCTVPVLLLLAAGSNCVLANDFSLDLTLKNLYAKRDFDDSQRASIGSWTQGVIARAQGDYDLNDQTALTYTGSLQYAQRLSEDRHLNDMIIPFDVNNKEQASDYNKITGSIGLKHKQHKISWGEQWVDTPLATTDYSRQLMTIYQGVVYSGQFSDDLKLDVGYLNRFSPRNEENFRKISVAQQTSDGLGYIDLKYAALDKKLETELFLSELKDLYNQYSVGLNYKTEQAGFKLNSKFRYYYNHENGSQKLGEIDNQYFGVMQYIGYGANTLGLGVQKIHGKNDFPMLDGAVPVLSYVNWTQGTFNKANELTYHFTFQHDASWLVPGLNLMLRYMDGQDYVANGQRGLSESEFDLIVNYRINQGLLKGLGFQWLNINYKNDLNGDYVENRFFTTFTKKF